MARRRDPKRELFRQLFNGQKEADYRKWIAMNTRAFCESRHVYSGEIPPDMQDEFTDWLRLQHMEVARDA